MMFKSHFFKGSDWALKFGFYLAEASLGLTVILIVIDVFARNLMGIGLTYTTEYCGYLLAAIIFLGAPYSFRCGEFIRIEMLGKKTLQKLEFVYVLCAIAISVVFLHGLIRLVTNSYQRDILAPTLTNTPLWIPQLALPVGVALMLLALTLGLSGHAPTDDETGDPDSTLKDPA